MCVSSPPGCFVIFLPLIAVFFVLFTFGGVMDFILSKIINRPRTIATSDDEEIAKALVDIETHQVPYGGALFEVKTCCGDS